MPLVQVGTATSAFGSTTLTVNNPTGVANDDALVMHVMTIPRTVVPTVSGFTQRQSVELVADDVLLTVLTKVASGEGASQSLGGIGSAAFTFAGLQAWRGCDPTNLFDAVGSGNTGNGTSATADGIVPAISTALLLYFAAWGVTDAGTPPAGMTEVLDATDGAGVRLYSASQILNAGGTTGNKAATYATAANYLAMLMTLNPKIVQPPSIPRVTLRPGMFQPGLAR